jgi:aldehyde dehydrogenase (NAD+)
MGKAGVEDVDDAVADRKAFNEGPWPRIMPLEQSRVMHKIASLLRDRTPKFAVMEATNCGKISVESRGDISASASCFEYYAGLATHRSGEQIPINGPLLDNYPTVNPPAAISGGYLQSGLGRELSRHVMDLYTQTKNVVVNLNPPPFDWYARWPEDPKT